MLCGYLQFCHAMTQLLLLLLSPQCIMQFIVLVSELLNMWVLLSTMGENHMIVT